MEYSDDCYWMNGQKMSVNTEIRRVKTWSAAGANVRQVMEFNRKACRGKKHVEEQREISPTSLVPQ